MPVRLFSRAFLISLRDFGLQISLLRAAVSVASQGVKFAKECGEKTTNFTACGVSRQMSSDSNSNVIVP